MSNSTANIFHGHNRSNSSFPCPLSFFLNSPVQLWFYHVYRERRIHMNIMYTDAEPTHGFACFQIVLVNELIPISSTLNYPHHFVTANSASTNGHDNEANADSAQQIRNCFRFLLIHNFSPASRRCQGPLTREPGHQRSRSCPLDPCLP